MSISKLKGIAVFMVMLIMMIPIVHASELNLVYDANGNLVTGDGKYREYNSLNQLVRLRNGSTSTDPISEEYVHDPVAERILLKQVYNSSGQVSERVYYVDENFVRVVNATGSYDFTYVKHEGQLVAQLNPDGTKLYMHDDLEGSTSAITNESGQIIENTTYSPFGEILTGGAVSRFDSEGKEFDSVVGDNDFNFRKMNPSWGIFLQPDTLISNVYDPQSLNRYMFERGNPYKNKDPTGHFAQFIAAAVIIYSVIETAVDLVGTTLDVIDLIEDPSNVDNRIAIELDLIDLFSGPISNPGPSGTLYKMAQKARTGLQVTDIVQKNLDKKGTQPSNPQQEQSSGKNTKNKEAKENSNKQGTRVDKDDKRSALQRFWDKAKETISTCKGSGCKQKK